MPTKAAVLPVRKTILSSGRVVGAEFPKTILQTLNEQHGDIYYGVDPFTLGVDAWNGCPLVFNESGIHPELDDFESNPEDAMKGVDAVVAGNLKDTRVEIEGQPRLMGNPVITLDRALELWKEGNLSLSTAFSCDALTEENGGTSIAGNIKPNHILLFPRDKANPKDKGTFILNSEGKMNPTLKSALDTIAEALKGKPDVGTQSANSKTEEIQMQAEIDKLKADVEKLSAANTDLNGKVAASKTELDAKTAELEALKVANTEQATALAKVEQEKKDAAWVSLKNTLPKGMTATPETEGELRKMAESDPLAFSAKLATIKVANSRGKEGDGIDDAAKDYLATKREFDLKIGKKVM
jgi:hypothetical protein